MGHPVFQKIDMWRFPRTWTVKQREGLWGLSPPPLEDKNTMVPTVGIHYIQLLTGCELPTSPPGQYLYPPLEVPKVSPPLIETVPLNPLLLQVEEELDDELRAYGLDPRVNRLTQTQLNQAKLKVKTRRRSLPNVSS